jgi:hypothetical protein
VVVSPHPLLAVLLSAAAGEFPPADGGAVFLPPLANGGAAVVSLTGRVYVATDRRLSGLDGFGSALQPWVLRELAGPVGEIGTLDVTLAAHGLGGGDLPARHDLADHPRVRHALGLRQQVRVYGDDRGLVTVAAGLAGRTEISVEVFTPGRPGGDGDRSRGGPACAVDNSAAGQRDRRWQPVASFEGAGGQAAGRVPGVGRALIREALRLVPAGEPVFAAVAPGNARSLRAFLAEGFLPIGSEVIIQP